jgi:hypothetical protein
MVGDGSDSGCESCAGLHQRRYQWTSERRSSASASSSGPVLVPARVWNSGSDSGSSWTVECPCELGV